MTIDEEKKILLKWKEEWLSFSANPGHAVDLISDLSDFRTNTHENFPNINKFYFNDNEYLDTFIGDAIDELQAYLENKEENHFIDAIEHLKNALNYMEENLDRASK